MYHANRTHVSPTVHRTIGDQADVGMGIIQRAVATGTGLLSGVMYWIAVRV